MSQYLGIRMKPNDDKILRTLAKHLERSLSDTIRYSLRQVARDEGLLPEKKIPELGEIQQIEVRRKPDASTVRYTQK